MNKDESNPHTQIFRHNYTCTFLSLFLMLS